jgi:hypothetical protein
VADLLAEEEDGLVALHFFEHGGAERLAKPHRTGTHGVFYPSV